MSTLHDAVTVTKATLNSPPYINRSITVVLMITNNSCCKIQNLALTDIGVKSTSKVQIHYNAESAVMFLNGEKVPVAATADKNKITLKGISIPPRESVFIFYRLTLT